MSSRLRMDMLPGRTWRAWEEGHGRADPGQGSRYFFDEVAGLWIPPANYNYRDWTWVQWNQVRGMPITAESPGYTFRSRFELVHPSVLELPLYV